MKTKLTLSLNQNIIEEAKKYAKLQGKSLSKLIEEYFISLGLTNKNSGKIAITDKEILQSKGSLHLPSKSVDIKDILTKKLIEKYIHD